MIYALGAILICMGVAVSIYALSIGAQLLDTMEQVEYLKTRIEVLERRALEIEIGRTNG
jgi:hypothetical protein